MDAPTRPAKARQLTADLSLGDGLQEMLAGAHGALSRRANDARYPTAEAIHRFRVGLRRLRSILSAFGDAFPERERHALSDRLRAVAQRYGRVREWDVFLGTSLAPLRAEMPEEMALAALERQARKARRAALPPGDTLKSHLAAIEQALAEAPWLQRPAPARTEIWAMPLRDYAVGLLDERHRKLRKRLKRVDLADAANFHRLRIRVKKLRYPIELLRSLFDKDLAEAYLKRLVQLQDLMGRMNDARVAGTLVKALAPAPPLRAQHLLDGWIAREIETCRERFPARARAFRRADPFWEAQ